MRVGVTSQTALGICYHSLCCFISLSLSDRVPRVERSRSTPAARVIWKLTLGRKGGPSFSLSPSAPLCGSGFLSAPQNMKKPSAKGLLSRLGYAEAIDSLPPGAPIHQANNIRPPLIHTLSPRADAPPPPTTCGKYTPAVTCSSNQTLSASQPCQPGPGGKEGSCTASMVCALGVCACARVCERGCGRALDRGRKLFGLPWAGLRDHVHGL